MPALEAGPAAGTVEQIMQHLRGNGIYLPIVILVMLPGFLLPLLACLVGSYTIAGEAENHTCAPCSCSRSSEAPSLWRMVHRQRIHRIGLLIMGVASLVAGGAFFGLHPMQLLLASGTVGGPTVGVGHALALTLLGYPTSWSAWPLWSHSRAFSTLTNSSLTGGRRCPRSGDRHVGPRRIQRLDFLKPYLITSHFDAWQNLLQRPILYGPIWKGLVNFAIWIGGTTGVTYFNSDARTFFLEGKLSKRTRVSADQGG